MKWRSYPGYKPSGVEWLGKVPEHWGVRKLKHISSVQFSNVDKHTVEGERPVRLCNYVDVYYNSFITADLNFMEATAPPAQIAKFVLRRGDVIITKDSEAWDDIAIPAYVSSDMHDVLCGYHLAQIRPDPKWADGKYLFRAFCSRGINDQFRVAATGITRYGLGKYWLDNGLFLVPPVEEQRAIAAFLDRETARIDALMEKKTRQIELLQEKRAALISHAVTKGLDPTVPLKDSGVEWLGHIPSHWDVKRLKNVCSLLRDGTHLPPPRILTGIPLLSVRNIVDGKLVKLGDDSFISEDDFEKLNKSFSIRKNDVVLAIVGATIGKVAIIYESEPFHIQRSLAIFRPKYAVLHFKFLSLFLQGSHFQQLLWRYVSFSAQPGIYLTTLSNFHFPIPPLPEQRDIIESLSNSTAEIGALIIKIQDSIDKLKEYRTALISAAVTGQIDVREAAA